MGFVCPSASSTGVPPDRQYVHEWLHPLYALIVWLKGSEGLALDPL